MRLFVKVRVNVGAFDERDDYREATHEEMMGVGRTLQACGLLPCPSCGHLAQQEEMAKKYPCNCPEHFVMPNGTQGEHQLSCPRRHDHLPVIRRTPT